MFLFHIIQLTERPCYGQVFLEGGDDIQGTETVHSLICDRDNNLYFFGATSSLDFPIQGEVSERSCWGNGQFWICIKMASIIKA